MADLTLACLAVLMSCAVVLALYHLSWRRTARELYRKNSAIWSREPVWVDVSDDGLEPWRADRPAEISRTMKALGFTQLGAIEDRTNVDLMAGERLVMTVFTGDEGTVTAAAYEVFANEVVEFETAFADGHVVGTGNNAKAGLLVWPPEQAVTHAAFDTPIEDLLATHRRRVQARLTASPSQSVVVFQSIQDVLASQLRQHRRKREFRRSFGYLTADEFQRIAANTRLSTMAARAIFNEYSRLARQAGAGAIELGRPTTR